MMSSLADGFSMEPDLHDGDTLYISHQLVVHNGDIVIANYKGDVYVKHYRPEDSQHSVLQSSNPDNPDIDIDLAELDDPEDFRIIAIVVDRETPIKGEQLI